MAYISTVLMRHPLQNHVALVQTLKFMACKTSLHKMEDHAYPVSPQLK